MAPQHSAAIQSLQALALSRGFWGQIECLLLVIALNPCLVFGQRL